jgi:hypothetical protein
MTPWFGPKDRYDFGIASWQGGVATAMFLAALFADRRFFQPGAFNLPVWTKPASTCAVILCFLALVWLKYEREDAD